MTVSINGTNGLVFQDGTTQNAAALTGFRNRLINGSFNIWQRSGTNTITADTGYGPDRWTGDAVNSTYSATLSHTRSLYVDSFNNAPIYAMSVTSGATAPMYVIHEQAIENLNAYDLSGQTVTLSFKLKRIASFTGGAISVAYGASSVVLGSMRDSTTKTADIVNITSVSNSTYTTYSVSFTAPQLGQNDHLRVAIYFYGLTGTPTNSELYRISEIQLEKGGIATQYERRSMATEQMLAERYFRRLAQLSGATGSATQVNAWGQIQPAMRVTPSVSASGPLNFQGTPANNSSQSAATVGTAYNQPYSIYLAAVGNFSGLTQNHPGTLGVPVNNSNILYLNAEI